MSIFRIYNIARAAYTTAIREQKATDSPSWEGLTDKDRLAYIERVIQASEDVEAAPSDLVNRYVMRVAEHTPEVIGEKWAILTPKEKEFFSIFYYTAQTIIASHGTK